ncbi:glycoside hydrolase family 30 beta sandwich domain-containing protein [Granulicella sp. 5B5]|uniref:glycoside hydrolase family 30 protein n=1 Tax=Granulicella sp. 5B5 TaxID=1617967 RepID=UPI00210498AC|nr:glycoside hydrolase family 30 beta sandwich domain-containing protein [Granulicella sp. 5B5]
MGRWLVLWIVGLGVAQGQVVKGWLTTPDRSALLAEQPVVKLSAAREGAGIVVDASQKMQTVEGFGFALTGGSAELMMKLPREKRLALEKELVGAGGIGVSYVRVSVGSSDMDDHAFTCDDVSAGGSDVWLTQFSLGEYERTVVPVLREMRRIDPRLRVLGSPWSAPAWMKTNDDLKGGELKRADYFVYARYLVKWMEAMRKAGVPVDTITMQNEPLNPKNTPSMVMTAEEQRDFLRDALGPAMREVRIATKVILYDHNCDHPDYPETVLADARAAKYAVGSGFHLYRGKLDAMTEAHERFPEKGIYFTEQMVVDKKGATELKIAEPVSREMIGAMRNWSRTVLLWNLAADAKFGPHTNHGGCPVCEGAVTIEGDTVSRNLAFYTVAQVAKFVPPGSVRVASTEVDGVSDVAFVTSAKKTVLVVANTSDEERDVPVRDGGRVFVAKVPEGAAETFVW